MSGQVFNVKDESINPCVPERSTLYQVHQRHVHVHNPETLLGIIIMVT